MNLLDYFPEGYTPNDQQVRLLNHIGNAINSGEKFIICSAPTGTGKSFISKTLANASGKPSEEWVRLITEYLAYKQNGLQFDYHNECINQPRFGTFALTITKALQDQYNTLFNDAVMLKGKNNYQCAIDDSYSVDLAPCLHTKSLKNECWKKNICPYYNARNDALISPFATLNYKMFMALPEHLKYRKFIVCDEASELEEEIVREFTCVVNYKLLKHCEIDISPANISNHSKMKIWIENLSSNITDKVNEYEDVIKKAKKKSSKQLENIKIKLIQLKNILMSAKVVIETWNDSEYLIEGDVTGIKFQPLKIDKLSKYLFDYGTHIILMSATIIDPNTFAKTLGIEKFKYIEAESTFDSKRGPIYCLNKFKLNAYNLKSNLPRVVDIIEKICLKHKNDKGIIHTHSNEITNFIKNTLAQSDRYIFREPGVNNELILQQHTDTNKPTVIVTPSMVHGVDLKDDLARFQIIVKAPYSPLTNTRVKKMFESNNQWYVTKMLSSLIQACGRGVRSKQDSCVTYILDGKVIETILSCKDLLPKYFLDRIV